MLELGNSNNVWALCALTTVLTLAPWQHAPAQSATSQPTAAPSPDTCTPACATGFECTQGFCIAVTNTPVTESGDSIAAPGLALGAEPEKVQPKPHRRPKARIRPGPSEDEGDDVDERQRSDDVQDWSDYRHQGFYFRLGLGLGLGWASGSRVDFDNSGLSPANSDLTGEGEFSIGGTIGPVAFGYRGLLVPPLTAFTGAFVDVYPDTLEGLHIEASAGFAGDATDDFAGTIGLGHDFFFAREWSFGLTARAMRTFGDVTISSVSLNASILCH